MNNQEEAGVVMMWCFVGCLVCMGLGLVFITQ